MTIIMMGLLLVYGLICIPPAKEAFEEKSKIAIIISILIASALIITMAQLGPTYIDYQLSARMEGFSYDEATKYSLNPGMLKHFFLPLLFPDNFATDPNTYKYLIPNNVVLPWLLTVYPGFLIMPLAILCIVSDLSRKNLFWLFILILAIAFALGNDSPIYRIFYKIFPFFRFPEKFMFLASFSLLILAGCGTDRLFFLLHKLNVRSSIVFTLISIILVIDLFIAHKNLNPLYESAFYQKHHPYLQVILDDHDIFRVYNSNPEISDNSINESILDHHQRWQSLLMPNLGVLHYLDHIDGRAGLELRYQYIITEILEKSWSEKIPFLRLANVKYIISSDDLSKNPEICDWIEKINPIVFKIKDYLPRAWIVKQLQPIKKGTVDELLEYTFDPLHTAIAKGEIISRYDHPSFTGINNIVYERNNKIHIEVTTETPGILVLSESSYPGWQVFVDGKERECLWLNLLFQGVEIEEGSHQIDFIYHPKNFNFFLSISIVSAMLFLLIWLCYTQFGRKIQ